MSKIRHQEVRGRISKLSVSALMVWHELARIVLVPPHFLYLVA